MLPVDILHDLIFDYTLRTVAIGSGLLGALSGALGSYAVLRKQSLLGDAMSHAALPGIALAFLVTGSKETLVLVIGAAAAGWLGTLAISWITGSTRIKYDTALGMILSVFFGVGLVMLTFIQRLPEATQAGLDKFMFGQAAALMERDVHLIGAIGLVALIFVLGFWKEFKLLSFDPDFGRSIGLPIKTLDFVLTTLLVVAIVLGLQTVGVVLMSAMVVAPAAAARQWTDRMGVMITLAGLFGLAAGASGAIASSLAPRLPTGPVIVVAVSVIVLMSLAFAPHRGLVAGAIRRQRSKRLLRTDAVLEDLYTLAVSHGDRQRPHSILVLRTMRSGDFGIRRSLSELQSRGLVSEQEHDSWALTEQGFEEASRIAGGRNQGVNK
jgi:manganese/zinc/iron transport system permease protein